MATVFGALVAAAGCSAGPDGAPTSASGTAAGPASSSSAVVLRGVYDAVDGDFQWIDFLDDTTYALWRSAPCSTTVGTDDSCGQNGTYAVDSAGTSLTLTNATTGTATTFGLSAVQSAAPASVGSDVTGSPFQPLDLIGSPASDAGLITTSPTPLVNGQAPASSLTVTSATGAHTLNAAADLSVGVFGECSLAGPLKPLLGSLLHTLEEKGIEISAELLVVYNKELNSGENTIEVLFGGGGALSAAAAVGLTPAQLTPLLENFSTNAGLLVGATISLDFDGTFGNVHFSFDAYSGADLFAGSGGRWKLIWSQDPSEVGETGYWASITVANGAACKVGGVVFASDGAVSWLWNAITGLLNPPARAPACGVPSTGDTACDACMTASCCTQATACSAATGCPDLFQCKELASADWSYAAGCSASNAAATAPAADLVTCMQSCETACGTAFAPLVAPQ